MTTPGIRTQPVSDDYKTIDAYSFLQIFDIGVADGTFKPVVIPADCKKVLIQVGTGSVTDFTSFNDSPIGFHLSKTGHATNKDWINCIGSISVGIVAPTGTTVFYIRAATGGRVTGSVLA